MKSTEMQTLRRSLIIYRRAHMGTREQREYTGRFMNARDVRTGVYGKLQRSQDLHSFLVVLSISLAFFTNKEASVVTNTT